LTKQSSKQLHFLMSGGGPAALAMTASLLKKADQLNIPCLRVTIFEQAPHYDRDVGGILSLSTSIALLKDLGLENQIRREGIPLKYFKLMHGDIDDSKPSSWIGNFDMTQILENCLDSRILRWQLKAEFGLDEHQQESLFDKLTIADDQNIRHNTWIMRRGDLINALYEQVKSDDRVKFHFGRRVSQVIDAGVESKSCSDDKVCIRHSDTLNSERDQDAFEQGDFLIGCDGIRSVVRDCVDDLAKNPPISPVYSGISLGGGTVPAAALKDDPKFAEMFQHSLVQYATSKGISLLVANASRDGDLAWGCGFKSKQPPTTSAANWTDTTSIETYKKMVKEAGFTPFVQKLISLTEGPSVELPIFHHEISLKRRWSVGRTILIGDASVVITPWVGQGANLGCLDGGNLANQLMEGFAKQTQSTNERFDDDDAVEKIFSAYEKRRKRDKIPIGALSNRIGQLFHSENKIVMRLRDMLYPRFLGSPLAMASVLRDTVNASDVLNIDKNKKL